MILHGDSLDMLQDMEDNSIDFVCTDPPYGYSFMGKDWDKAVPSVEIWQECLRVLKPGAFMCVMSAPRSDVQCAMISRLQEAGFRLDFTPIYWTYASGFPKAGNIGKLVDKRLGAEREVLGVRTFADGTSARRTMHYGGNSYNESKTVGANNLVTAPATHQAKALDGSYAGFQPKPAVEVIIVAMKPLSEKTYVDQALANGKGISWLDDARIPFKPTDRMRHNEPSASKDYHNPKDFLQMTNARINGTDAGRFPANLLCSDDVLNDGVERKVGGDGKKLDTGDKQTVFGGGKHDGNSYADSGSYSRYFDLDKWASTLPFLIVPKASKSEKNKGLEGFADKQLWDTENSTAAVGNHNPVCQTCKGSKIDRGNGVCSCETPDWRAVNNSVKNHHPTVKPLKLMSYLITLFSRPGDTILDPFVGSGTTVVAAKQLNRKGIGIEREAEYAEIARARVEATEYVEPEEDKQLELV